jgi:hypothetical protein
MAHPIQSQNAAQKNAEHYFRRAEPQPETPGKQMRKWEHAASATNTARLRELRLAKEAAEKEVADKLTAENAVAEPTPRRKRAPAVRSVLRMSY